MQNLSVREVTDGDGAATGRYEVVAGGRRFRALKRLAKTKAIKKSHPVPCAVIDGFSTTEIGLAENLHCPMHPADQYEAWARLAAEGQSPADIAARFGVSEQTVQQRLRLGKVSPPLLDRYREGEMTLDVLMAFTLSDDPEEQERVWAELPAWNRHPDLVRRALTRAHTAAGEPFARFVGLDAYEAAGGRVLRDLFDERRTWLLDGDLLGRLAAAKLEARGRGGARRGLALGGGRLRLPAGQLVAAAPLSDDPRADPAGGARAGADGDPAGGDRRHPGRQRGGDALATEAAEIEQRLAEIDRALEAFAPEQLALAGAVVWLDHQGAAAVERGLVRHEDEPAARAARSGTSREHGRRISRQPDGAIRRR